MVTSDASFPAETVPHVTRDQDRAIGGAAMEGSMADKSMRITLRVTDENADEQRVDELTVRLRDELRALDVRVGGARGGEVPVGAKSVELAALGTLVVTLSGSPVLAAVVTAVSNWLGQRRQRTVRLEVDGDAVELSGLQTREQRELIDMWLRRRGAVDAGFLGSRHALIVANTEYQDPGLRQLRAPAHDAEQLASVLGNPEIGGFEVRTLLNESASTINEAVEDFFADRGPDELLLLHFSGHGVKDEAGELYFAAATTKLNRLGATAVAADFVSRRMNRSNSRRIVLLLDCCYSGAFGRGMVARAGSSISIEEQFGGRGRAVITASSAVEYAFEGPDLADTSGEAGPSVFTSAIIEGLDTGDADLDQDGHVGLDELYEFVYQRVRRATPHQTPGKWTFDLQGDLHIARRARPVTTPTALPPELQEAIDHPLSGMRAGAVGELGQLLTRRHEGLALAARLALERLVNDDSRTVASAAAEALGAATPPDRHVRMAAPAPPDPPQAVPTEPARIELATREHRPPRPPLVVSVVSAVSAVLLAVGFSAPLTSGGSSSTRLFPVLPFHYTVWLWLLVGAALILGFTPPGRPERGLSRGLVFGAAACILGLLATLTATGSSRLQAGFWITTAGVSLIVIAVAVDGRRRLLNAVCATVALIAIAAENLVLASSSDSERAGWLPFIGLPVAVLVAVAVTRGVRRWRTRQSRRALWTGAAATALLLVDTVLAAVDGSSAPAEAIYLPALVIILLVDVLMGDGHPVPLAVARLSVILGLPMRAAEYHGYYSSVYTAGVHILIEIVAAAFALTALYARATVRNPLGS